ncbi:MAG: hypothetical protein LCH36_13350 [Actinobacteria bacterium]|jgi:hypothetical protein|nr:hypothetical protein [Actinomycetota bacterium]
MADLSSIITVDDGVVEYLKSVQGRDGDVPTPQEIRETRGEATGPAYQYHEALDQFGQHISDQTFEFMSVLERLHLWIADVVADLGQTDEEAAALLRRIQGEVESFGAGASLRTSSAQGVATGQPRESNASTSNDWNA